MNAPLSTRLLDLSVNGAGPLDVRRFQVTERISGMFEIRLEALSLDPSIDLDAAIGQAATFAAKGGASTGRSWTGIVRRIGLVRAEERGLSTYEVVLAPRVWLLTQNVDYRIFQQMSEIDIVLKVLGKWGISPKLLLTSQYKKRKYRVQYRESDYDFVCRMLADAGVSFYFDEDGQIVLSDAPHDGPARSPLPYRGDGVVWSAESVTDMRLERALRPGRVTLRDHDHRKPPTYKLLATASGPNSVESQVEQYHYLPGAFLFESGRGESTPMADDRGKYRTDEGEAEKLATRRLHAHRTGAKTLTFCTTALDVAPGTVASFLDHPNAEIAGGARYLVTGTDISGTHDGPWIHNCVAGSASVPFHPEPTAHPAVNGVESATVVGPPGGEIHVDELGRVRVHFHWDRDSQMNHESSCWIHVSQPWGGGGYGGINLPRVGQEVVVDFLNGDPDRPIIVGRVFTSLQPVPYKLPEAKTQTVFRSQSTQGKAGYNEIRYEDQAGSELFRVQAERDYHKLVKNDERAKIENDVFREIVRDNVDDVGRDRVRRVGNDERVEIAKDQSTRVGGDQTVEVEKDRSVRVLGDQSFAVAGDEDIRIGRSRDVLVGGSFSLGVVGNKRETIDQNHSMIVTNHQAFDIGRTNAISVGDAFQVQVKLPEYEGKGDTGNSSSGEEASGSAATSEKEREGPTALTLVDKKIVLSTGDGATITMEGATITLSADVIILMAKKKIEAEAESETVQIRAKKDVALESEQTVHLTAKGGAFSIQAEGGDVAIGTDHAITAKASGDLTARGQNVALHAESSALVHGKTSAKLTAPTAHVEGDDYAMLTAPKARVIGKETAYLLATEQEVLIESPLVRINP